MGLECDALMLNVSIAVETLDRLMGVQHPGGGPGQNQLRVPPRLTFLVTVGATEIRADFHGRRWAIKELVTVDT